jgi:hypothetical protein
LARCKVSARQLSDLVALTPLLSLRHRLLPSALSFQFDLVLDLAYGRLVSSDVAIFGATVSVSAAYRSSRANHLSCLPTFSCPAFLPSPVLPSYLLLSAFRLCNRLTAASHTLSMTYDWDRLVGFLHTSHGYPLAVLHAATNDHLSSLYSVVVSSPDIHRHRHRRRRTSLLIRRMISNALFASSRIAPRLTPPQTTSPQRLQLMSSAQFTLPSTIKLPIQLVSPPMAVLHASVN